MDDYVKELADLQLEVDQLVEEEGDAETIAELEMQIQVLGAIYERARDLHALGTDDPDLRRQLAMRGFGEWSLDNVYAFVYESVIELPDEGHRKFVAEIVQTDFAGLLAS